MLGDGSLLVGFLNGWINARKKSWGVKDQMLMDKRWRESIKRTNERGKESAGTKLEMRKNRLIKCFI